MKCIRFKKKGTNIHTRAYRHTDKVVHRGAPLLKIVPLYIYSYLWVSG